MLANNLDEDDQEDNVFALARDDVFGYDVFGFCCMDVGLIGVLVRCPWGFQNDFCGSQKATDRIMPWSGTHQKISKRQTYILYDVQTDGEMYEATSTRLTD